jgi:hypothetical protein
MLMSFQPGYPAYTQGFGTAPAGVSFPYYSLVAPTTTTVQGNFGPFQLGQRIIVPNTGEWVLIGLSTAGGALSATWVQTVNASGDVISVTGTTNQITATPTTGAVVLSTPSTFIAPGSIAATLGNITATNGNVVLGTAGNKLVSTSVGSTTAAGANSFGTVALVSGTATVATTAVTASSIIFLTRLIPAGTSGTGAIGMISVGTITAGTSFVINALTTADLATVVTNDISTIGWMIVN